MAAAARAVSAGASACALPLAAIALLALTACEGPHTPDSVLTTHSETNVAVLGLWKYLFFFGTLVFIVVETLLMYVIFKFRRRPGDSAEPRHVHGNTTLEVLWTAIPAVILVFIAVPTVRTIFRTQAKAKAGALQVEVIGHQWWWEFRYPEYNITTANELYLPTGRTVNFALKTADVLHSFWIPALSGKRDLIANHTNYLWFTPDSALGAAAWNGHCAEYCGASHANMKFRVYTVSPAQFASWAKGQQQVAVFGATPTAAAPGTGAPQSSMPVSAGDSAAAQATARQRAGIATAGPKAQTDQPAVSSDVAARNNAAPTVNASGAGTPQAGVAGARPGTVKPQGPITPQTAQQQAEYAGVPAGYTFPMASMPANIVPMTPIPAEIAQGTLLAGDPTRGLATIKTKSCGGCHYINGNPVMMGKIGPNLTHVGSRNTIAGGLFPNDAANLSAWLKNARAMKPGVTMPTLGIGQYDPMTKARVTPALGGLTNQEVADIVAYLHALK
ncbi:MAG TPA: cytochrome c oxidase subunit II [Gemmatirosa sp.]